MKGSSMSDHSLIGKFVYAKDSFRKPMPHEHGIVVGVLPKANGEFNYIVAHADGSDTSIPPSGLEEFSPENPQRLVSQILDRLWDRHAAPRNLYDQVYATTRQYAVILKF